VTAVTTESVGVGCYYFFDAYVKSGTSVAKVRPVVIPVPLPVIGIGNWTEAQFTAGFRHYQGGEGQTIPVGEGGCNYNTLMSWTLFADMPDEDLAVIYAFPADLFRKPLI
jgi:hypothetical protein